MNDITGKRVSLRTAKASGEIAVDAEVARKIQEKSLPKGNLYDTARAAAFIGAKRTHEIIPHCHPVAIDSLEVEFRLTEENGEHLIKATVEAKSIGRTGIEMEALSGLSSGLLAIYDLLKPLGKKMEIRKMQLDQKTGGRSQDQKKKTGQNAAILVCSDSTAAGEREDKSGKIIREMLQDWGARIDAYEIVPDEIDLIQKQVRGWAEEGVAFVLVTGGTGLGPRDNTTEAIEPILQKKLPGVAEAMRGYGFERTQKAMLSRSLAGSIDKTLVLCLPGSSAGVRESLQAILPGIFHAHSMLHGGQHDGQGSSHS